MTLMTLEGKVFAVSMVMAAACGGSDTTGSSAGASSGNSAATTGTTAAGSGMTASTTGGNAAAADGKDGGEAGAGGTGGTMSTGGSGRASQPDAGGMIDGAGGAEAGARDSGGMASSGVAATGCGASSDAGAGACQQATAVDRTCMTSTDCVAVNHQTDYIGQARLLGIRSSETVHFADLEKSCKPTLQSFNLPAITADDGSLVDASSRAVACQAGLCTTFSPVCGHPCPCGHVCITCGAAANASVCSQLCSMGPCTETPRTSCLGGTSLNGGEGDFCFDPVFAGGFMSTSCHR